MHLCDQTTTNYGIHGCADTVNVLQSAAGRTTGRAAGAIASAVAVALAAAALLA